MQYYSRYQFIIQSINVDLSVCWVHEEGASSTTYYLFHDGSKILGKLLPAVHGPNNFSPSTMFYATLPVQRLVSSHSWCTLDGDLYACIWWVSPFHGASEQARVKLRGTTSVKNVKSESFFILIKKVWSEESRSNNSTVCLLTSSFVTTIGFRSLYGILNIDEGTMIRIVAQIREVLTWIFYFLY